MKNISYLSLVLIIVSITLYTMQQPPVPASDPMIKLESGDGKGIMVAKSVAELSPTIKDLIKDLGGDQVVPLPGIDGQMLKYAMEVLKELGAKIQQQKQDLLEPKEFVTRPDGEFIAKNVLPIVKKYLPKSTAENSIRAFEYLGISVLSNSVCWLFAEQLQKKPALTLNDIEKLAKELLKLSRLVVYAQRCYMLQRIGAKFELSIGDHIALNGMPEIIRGYPFIWPTVRLDNQEITDLDGINQLREVEGLYLSNNKIITIEPGTFSAMSNLKALTLVKNHITSLKPGMFRGLSNLADLNLADNKISTINLGSFGGLGTLFFLGLGYNLLTTLQPNVFIELSALKLLVLNNNDLNRIEVGTFNGLNNLEMVSLQGNPLQGTKIDFRARHNLSDKVEISWPTVSPGYYH